MATTAMRNGNEQSPRSTPPNDSVEGELAIPAPVNTAPRTAKLRTVPPTAALRQGNENPNIGGALPAHPSDVSSLQWAWRLSIAFRLPARPTREALQSAEP